MVARASIKVRKETYQMLVELMLPRETFDDVIVRLCLKALKGEKQ
jgi:predicted CopG family antitoxin